MKKCFFAPALPAGCATNSYAQTSSAGASTIAPDSQRALNGSLEASYRQITALSYSINADDFYVPKVAGPGNATPFAVNTGVGFASIAGIVVESR